MVRRIKYEAKIAHSPSVNNVVASPRTTIQIQAVSNDTQVTTSVYENVSEQHLPF